MLKSIFPLKMHVMQSQNEFIFFWMLNSIFFPSIFEVLDSNLDHWLKKLSVKYLYFLVCMHEN